MKFMLAKMNNANGVSFLTTVDQKLEHYRLKKNCWFKI